MTTTSFDALNAVRNLINSPDVMMRSIEMGSDDDLVTKDTEGNVTHEPTFGFFTLSSILDTLKMYATILRQSGTLSDNLKSKLHEATIEMVCIINRIDDPACDLENIIQSTTELKAGPVAQLHDIVNQLNAAEEYFSQTLKKLTEDDSIEPEKITVLTRRVVLDSLISAVTLDHCAHQDTAE